MTEEAAADLLKASQQILVVLHNWAPASPYFSSLARWATLAAEHGSSRTIREDATAILELIDTIAKAEKSS